MNADNISEIDQKITLDDFLKKNKWSRGFINYHIIPMVSAIWSMPPYEAGKMPMNFFLKFFQNHGLFKLKNRPQWYTVAQRSRSYVNKVLSLISGQYYKNYRIKSVKKISSGLQVYYGGNNEFFHYDKVILATHANEALNLIDNPSDEERNILSNFSYRENLAILHTDENIMPKNKDVWSSWNSFVDKKNTSKNSLSYWLNLLQNLKNEKNIFLTLNPIKKISEDKIIKKIKFTHPYFDQKALDNQKNLKSIQNKENILFCGSYFGYGFHEDGIKSSIEMLKNLND
jgi:predicted NAD/FAD-binding protein